MPAYFTLSGDVMTIDATDNSQVRIYTMEVTIDTQFEDAPIVFNTVQIDLRVCVITRIDAPTQPVSTEYLIFALSPLDIDLSSPGFVQQPACGYPLSETFTWEIPPGAPITQTGNYAIQVSSTTASDRDVYTVKLIDSANYAGTGKTYSNEISFTVTVTDPCLTTTLATFVIPNVSIEAGLTDVFEFAEVTDSAADSVSSATICGERTYSVYEIDADSNQQPQTIVTFARDATGAAHTLTTTTQDEVNDVGVHQMRLVVTLPDALYPSLPIDFTVTILTPVCDCTLLEWTPPQPETLSTTVKKIPSDTWTISKSTVLESSKSASPKIRACYIDGGPSCDETTEITAMVEYGGTFPTYFTRSGDDVTVNAVDNTQARTYIMEVTHSTVSNGD